MQRRSDIRWIDLGAVVVSTVLAGVVTAAPVAQWLGAIVRVPFLLFVPGYAVLAALFPRQTVLGGGADDGFAGVELLLLAVTTSIATAIVVGVNLGFTPLPIEATTVVGALASVSLVGVAIAAFRRIRHPEPRTDRTTVTSRLRQTGSGSITSGLTIANVAVVVAVLVAVASVAIVAATPQRGETYTEFGLLTENEAGELVATDYPSELTSGEPASLTFTVGNKEMETTEYVVVVTLARVTSDGSVVERSRLGTYRNELPAGETWQRQHDIIPELTGDGLRLTYLLYRGDLPAQPTAENAYRETHIWLDVQPE